VGRHKTLPTNREVQLEAAMQRSCHSAQPRLKVVQPPTHVPQAFFDGGMAFTRLVESRAKLFHSSGTKFLFM
jgi:hypothetical protein